MKVDQERGTYGFRFADSDSLPLCGLFAVGHERVTDVSYDWNGRTRTDGPLLLFQYTVEGQGELEVDGCTHLLEPGRAFLVEIPGEHRYRLPKGSHSWAFYFVLLRPHFVLPLWEQIKSSVGGTPYLTHGSSPILALKELYQYACEGRITDPYTASWHTYRFVMELARFASSKGLTFAEWPTVITAAVQFMDQNYNRMIGQEQLAQELGISKYHFLRTFTKFVGMTPGDYVNRIRIGKSIELLRQKDWSIEQIAISVGYSSGSYFIKVFRKLTGQTPAHFRSGSRLQYSRLFFD